MINTGALESATGQLLGLFGTNHILVFFAVLTRVSPLFIFAPVFSSSQIPPQAKAIVAVALSIGLMPAAGDGRMLPSDPAGIVGLFAVQFLIGLAFAFVLGVLMAALEVAGTIVDFMIGFSFGATIDPMTNNQAGPLSRMYVLIGTIVFLALNGDIWVIQGLSRTFQTVGVGQTPDYKVMLSGVNNAFIGIFGSALEVIAPIILALVLTDAGFGLVTRVVPQLNIFSIGLPVKVVVGLILITVTLPLVGTWIGNQLVTDVSAALHTVRAA